MWRRHHAARSLARSPSRPSEARVFTTRSEAARLRRRLVVSFRLVSFPVTSGRAPRTSRPRAPPGTSARRLLSRATRFRLRARVSRRSPRATRRRGTEPACSRRTETAQGMKARRLAGSSSLAASPTSRRVLLARARARGNSASRQKATYGQFSRARADDGGGHGAVLVPRDGRAGESREPGGHVVPDWTADEVRGDEPRLVGDDERLLLGRQTARVAADVERDDGRHELGRELLDLEPHDAAPVVAHQRDFLLFQSRHDAAAAPRGRCRSLGVSQDRTRRGTTAKERTRTCVPASRGAR